MRAARACRGVGVEMTPSSQTRLLSPGSAMPPSVTSDRHKSPIPLIPVSNRAGLSCAGYSPSSYSTNFTVASPVSFSPREVQELPLTGRELMSIFDRLVLLVYPSPDESK